MCDSGKVLQVRKKSTDHLSRKTDPKRKGGKKRGEKEERWPGSRRIEKKKKTHNRRYQGRTDLGGSAPEQRRRERKRLKL